MKKAPVFLYLLLMFSTVRAQYPAALPSSGAISIKTISDWMLAAGEITTGTYSISSLNSKSHLTDKTAPFSLSDWYGYQWVCGSTLNINHTAGSVAPVTKTVNYKTVLTNLSGASKCWITQNLGAEHSATSANDATAASGGWYWQFNRAQGTNVADDGTVTSTNWYTSINESSDWTAANDPCTLLLGTGWRIPTYSEWVTVSNNSAFFTSDLRYASVLILHNSGFSSEVTSMTLTARGANFSYWSATQDAATLGWEPSDASAHGKLSPYNVAKTCALSLRFLKD